MKSPCLLATRWLLNRRRMSTTTLVLMLGLVVVVAVLAQTGSGASTAASTGYDLSWWTVDGGGETGISGEAYTLLSTAGQPDAQGEVSGGEYTLLSGFWPGEEAVEIVYLPIVLKSYP